MNQSFVPLFVLIAVMGFSQETIQVEREDLGSIQVGSGPLQVSYDSNEEGFFSPTGPMVDGSGNLLFFPLAGRDARKSLIQFSKGTWSREAIFSVMKGRGWNSNLYRFSSQQGVVNVVGNLQLFFPTKNSFEIVPFEIMKKLPEFYDVYTYPLRNGAYIESFDPRFVYSTDILSGNQVEIRDQEETKSWMPTQPGGFGIGSDGFLYRNGVLWSAVRPTGNLRAENFSGKLITGHNIWVGGGIYGMERYFVIGNPQKGTELVLELPWALKDGDDGKDSRMFNYGIGPWGEIYVLIAPPQIVTALQVIMVEEPGGLLPLTQPNPLNSSWSATT